MVCGIGTETFYDKNSAVEPYGILIYVFPNRGTVHSAGLSTVGHDLSPKCNIVILPEN